MTKPILLIGGCHKYFDFLVAAIGRAKESDVWEVIGVVGDPLSSTATYDEATQILHLPIPDVYESLPAKLHATYCWIVANRPGIPGIFKTDDDIVWRSLKVLESAITLNQTIAYWGVHPGKCRAAAVNPRRIAYRFSDTSLRPSHPAAEYCYGLGYWISASVLPILCSASDEFSSATLEDVCTGAVLNAAGFRPMQVSVPFSEVPRTSELLALK